MVGALMHLENTVRPVIPYATRNLDRFINEPSQELWNGHERVFRYLRETMSLGTKFW